MSNKKSFDFKSFIMANKGKPVFGFDYLHIIYKSLELPTDFISYFSKLFCHDFKVVDGAIFISELFDSEYYQELLKSCQNKTEVQFWMNLLEVTGLFDEMSTDDAMKIAESIASCWNSKINTEFKNVTVSASVICDNDTGEVFVTIGYPSTAPKGEVRREGGGGSKLKFGE